MIVMPDQDVALAITAETADMQSEINLVWKYLLPAFKKIALPADANADYVLQKKLQKLALPLPVKNEKKPAFVLNEKTYVLEQNPLHIQQISFTNKNSIYNIKIQKDTISYALHFDNAKWNYGTTNMHGPSLTAASIENTSMLYPAKIAASYSWKDSSTLQLVLRYIETPHTETHTCHFDGNNLIMEVAESLYFGKNTTTIKGTRN